MKFKISGQHGQSLNAERASHFWKTYRSNKAIKQLAFISISNQWHEMGRVPAEPPIKIVFNFYFKNKRMLRDWDNCVPAVKAIQDALVQVGVIPDDNNKNVPTGIINVCVGTPRIEIELVKLS